MLTEKTVQVGIPGRLILPPLVPVPRAACEDCLVRLPYLLPDISIEKKLPLFNSTLSLYKTKLFAKKTNLSEGNSVT